MPIFHSGYPHKSTAASADKALITDSASSSAVSYITAGELFASGLPVTTDTISEKTSANGVTIDGLNFKDSKLNTNNSVVTNNITDSAVTTAKINDSAVTTPKIADGAVTFAKTTGIGWELLANVTLGSNGTSLASGTFTARKHLMIQALVIGASTGDVTLQFNGDTGANYATQFFSNGGAPSSNTSQTSLIFRHGALVSGGTQVTTGFVTNFQSNEKSIEWTSIGTTTGTGAANAPGRIDGAGKWANTSAQITSATLSCSGNMATGTKLLILGRD